jgi:membrane-bound lytic murein transglycosylase
MTSIQDVQIQTWHAVSPYIPANPAAAFFQEWLDRKKGYTGPLGVPVTPEESVSEGGTCQGFSSGCVLHWTGSAVESL